MAGLSAKSRFISTGKKPAPPGWLLSFTLTGKPKNRPAPLFQPFLNLPQIKRIYLEDFKHRDEPGLELLRLVACQPDEAVVLVHTLVEKIARIDPEVIEFMETGLVYKLPQLTREEIKIMLGLDVQLKQTRFYQEIAEEERREGKLEGRLEGKLEGRLEGKLEGKQEGRLEGERLFLTKLLTKRFGSLPDGIAAKLEQTGVEQLELWGERILEAQTLSQVFE